MQILREWQINATANNGSVPSGWRLVIGEDHTSNGIRKFIPFCFTDRSHDTSFELTDIDPKAFQGTYVTGKSETRAKVVVEPLLDGVPAWVGNWVLIT